LTRADFVRILTEPQNALIRQYVELLGTEAVTVRFAEGAAEAIADLAVRVNEGTENIGARRLYTIMEKLLEDVSFDAPEMAGREVVIDAAYVDERLRDIVRDQDVARYIL
jgi:ATP-dependent HslUV protease ATP-binding subunit HslU